LGFKFDFDRHSSLLSGADWSTTWPELSYSMHTTVIYGLVIQSDPLLLPSVSDAQVVDVVIRYGALDPLENLPVQGNQVLLQLPLDLRLLISNGCEVVVDVPLNFDPAVLRAYILGTAMAFILRQRGLLVLHASCVARGDRAIAFLGGSGWGKSTLASAFHQQGYRLITDDVMALRLDTDIPQVVPSFPEVKLLPDAMAAVGAGAEAMPMLHSLSHKHIQRLESRFALGPVPLKQLFVLRSGELNHIQSVPRSQAFSELIQHSRAAKMLHDDTCKIQHFHQCSHLVKNVPMAYLQRPRSLEQLPQLIEFIESYLKTPDCVGLA
jgi:hypothetical protein